MAAMTAVVAAVSDRRVEVFVSMNGLAAFARDVGEDERYGDGGRFAQLLKAKRAPDPLDLLRQGRELGELKLWACSMALDLLGWEVAHLVDGLFDGPLGLTKFLSDAEAGQLVSF